MTTATTKTSKTIVNIYCTLSALFFAACAFAQLNDPDPILWILGYVIGGCVFNGLVVMYHGSKHDGDDDARTMGRMLMNIFIIGNAAVVAYMTISLIPQIDFGLPVKEVAWSVLEFEEGREIAGLAILLAHVLKVRAYLAEDSSITAAEGKDNKSGNSSGGYGYIGTFVMVGAIIGAVYLWVYYQPEMNAKYETEHCDGAFGDKRAGVEL